jgi:hypothetical protein
VEDRRHSEHDTLFDPFSRLISGLHILANPENASPRSSSPPASPAPKKNNLDSTTRRRESKEAVTERLQQHLAEIISSQAGQEEALSHEKSGSPVKGNIRELEQIATAAPGRISTSVAHLSPPLGAQISPAPSLERASGPGLPSPHARNGLALSGAPIFVGFSPNPVRQIFLTGPRVSVSPQPVRSFSAGSAAAYSPLSHSEVASGMVSMAAHPQGFLSHSPQLQMQMKMQGPGMAPVPGALHSAYPVVGGTRDKSGRQRS